MPLIELHRVSKVYRLGERRIPAVSNVDLAIEAGELVGLWGPSGSGKTTLCNLIGSLDRPSTGSVLFEGRDVSALSDRRRTALRRGSMGFIFQSFHLLPVLSAVENVMMPLQIQGRSPKLAREAAETQLAAMGMAAHGGSRPSKLSGGEQQRVAIARALITDPMLVIADEPTANLDTVTALAVMDLIWRRNRESGTTFVLATHDQRLLDRVDRRILLRDGEVVEDLAGSRGAPAG